MDPEKSVRSLMLSVCDLKQDVVHPAARICHQMVTIGTKIYLHGGVDERNCYGDLFVMEIEKVTWKELAVNGFSKPSPMFGHTLSAWKDDLVLFGGLTSDTDDSANNEASTPPFKAPAFIRVYNPWIHNEQLTSNLFLLETYTLTWSQPSTSGNSPSRRAFHAAAVGNNFLFIHGGVVQDPSSGQAEVSDELHILSLESMTWLTKKQVGDIPAARFGHKVVYYSEEAELFLFGGADDDGALYSLNLSELTHEDDSQQLHWTRLQVHGTPPVSRSFHTFNLIGSRIFAFAGHTLTRISDLYVYEIKKMRWTKPLYEGNINYEGHAAAVLHDKLIVFGGAGDSLRDNTQAPSEALVESRRQSLTKSSRLFFLNVLEIKEGSLDNDIKLKIITIGDSGVGKSCLLTRFAQDIYSDFHVATIAIDFTSVVTMIKGRLCTLQLWDTGGQERFTVVTSFYYRNADAFILVFDATRRSSFEHLEFWLEQISQHHDLNSSTVLLLVGNKHDMTDQIEVTEEEARAYAEKIGATYVPASAKIASNVDGAFLSAASRLVELRRSQQTGAANRVQSQAKSQPAQPPSNEAQTEKTINITSSQGERSRRGNCGCR